MNLTKCPVCGNSEYFEEMPSGTYHCHHCHRYFRFDVTEFAPPAADPVRKCQRAIDSGNPDYCRGCLSFGECEYTKVIVPGVGPDAPKVENEKGGKQSYTPYRFILMDPKAMFKLAEVLALGEREYGRDNWRKVDCEDHVNHALIHINAWLAGDRQEDHLSHAFCRLMMAIGTEEVN